MHRNNEMNQHFRTNPSSLRKILLVLDLGILETVNVQSLNFILDLLLSLCSKIYYWAKAKSIWVCIEYFGGGGSNAEMHCESEIYNWKKIREKRQQNIQAWVIVRGTFCEIVTIKDLSGLLCSLGQDILDTSMIIPPWLIPDWFIPHITSLRQTPDLGSMTSHP